jgi:hypothetical protein
MGIVESNQQEQRFWTFLFPAGLIAGLILRFYLASTAQTPGHGDTAFYYTVAKNIVDGRGLVVDYVVYFLNGIEPIPHYSGDFWNPLASILLSIPMSVLGKSVFNATLATILFGMIPPIVGYLAAKGLSKSARFAAMTGILVFFAPIQIRTSVATDSIIFYGAFGSIALYFTILSSQKPYFVLPAALSTGLAQFTRQDGVLLLVVLEISILLMKSSTWKIKMGLGAGALIIHLLVLSPLMIKNYTEFHAIFPPGPSRTMFLTKYEDFHAYGIDLSWKSYRGELGILGIIRSKAGFAVQNLGAMQGFLDPIVAVLTISGLLNIVFIKKDTEKFRWLTPALAFAILVYLFYTVVASFSGPGSLPKSLAVLTPFIYIAIIDLINEYVRSKSLSIVIICILAIYTGYSGFEQAYAFNTFYNEIYKEYRVVKETISKDMIQRDLETKDIIVMTRNPWDVYEATGFKTVMIPNNNLNTVYYIAQSYEASYLLLPAPRRSLQPIYNGTQADSRFEFVTTIPNSNYPDPNFKIFRIILPPSSK